MPTGQPHSPLLLFRMHLPTKKGDTLAEPYKHKYVCHLRENGEEMTRLSSVHQASPKTSTFLSSEYPFEQHQLCDLPLSSVHRLEACILQWTPCIIPCGSNRFEVRSQFGNIHGQVAEEQSSARKGCRPYHTVANLQVYRISTISDTANSNQPFVMSLEGRAHLENITKKG